MSHLDDSRAISMPEIFSDVKLINYLNRLGLFGKIIAYAAEMIALCSIGLILLYNVPALVVIMILHAGGLFKIKLKKLSLVEKVIFVLLVSTFSTGIYIILNLLGFGRGPVIS